MTRDSVAHSPNAIHELRSRLANVRRHYRRSAILSGGAAVLALLLGWLCVECTLDYLLMFQWSIRAVLLMAALAGTAGLIWWLILRPLRSSLEDDAVALMIERALPAFRSRYIAAVQLARGDAARKSLVHALVAETAAMARTQPFHAVVDQRRARRASVILLAIAIVGAFLAWLGGEKVGPLVRRAMLSTEPVPRRTKIQLLFEKRILAVGDDFLIAVRAGGMIPREGRAQLAFGGGRRQDIPLPVDSEDRTRFSRLVRSVQEPFDLTIYLGDARTDPIRVRVKPRPMVLGIDATEHFPAYTKRSPERRSVTGLKLLAGSRLAVRVKANTRLSRGSAILYGKSREHPLAQSELKTSWSDRTTGEGEIQIPASDVGGLALRLVDEDGVESRNSTVYPIELIPDRPPEIRLITPPRREELLTAGATLLLGFEGRDDFGIAKAALHYSVDWTEGSKHQTIEFDLGAGLPKELARRFEWKTAQLRPPLREGQVLDYWIELVDANDVTGPGVTVLEHHQARIVSQLEKRAELAARLSDAMEGLGETRQNQERLNEFLGEFIFAKPPGAP